MSVHPRAAPAGGRDSPSSRYQVFEQLAVGGMGTIHRAYDRLAERDVAYKRLEITDDSARARMTALFQREYDTLARLPHPNIVQVYDYGKDAHGPYYVMELLTGSDLTALAPLPYREACRVLRDIASALALVHARRLLHRDVSPNNIRLTSEGRAKLIDFGALTPFGQPRELVGTPAFMAPESLAGAELDQRSDLYSLGALAYWALTRRTAVRVRSLDELIERLGEPIAPPSVHVPELPPELDALVMSLLAREPVARPPSAAYLIDQLTVIGGLAPESDERQVAFSYLAHPPLTGRSEVLGEVVRATAEGEQSRGQSVLIECGAGHGRSALLESAVLQAQLNGALVLRARGERSAGPFGVARKLTQLAFTLYPELIETGEARRSFYAPGGEETKGSVSMAEIAERHALLIAGVQRALLEVSRRHFVVVVVDDIHLADAESLALLASLAQEISQHRLTLLTSTLAGDARSLDPAIAKLRDGSRHVTLSTLDEPSVVELIESIFGKVPNTVRLSRWLHGQSGGVPGQVLDLARLLLQTGVVRYTLGTFTLPHDFEASDETVNLASAALARVSELDDDAQDLTRLLSLHDGALSAELLAEATGRAAPEVLHALEELKKLDLATQTGDGFALAGSSLRAALRGTLVAEQRNQLHVQLGRALLARSGDDIEARIVASLHLLAGGAEEEATAVAPKILSGAAAVRGVPLLEAALAIQRREGASTERRVRLLLSLVSAGFYGDIAAQRRHIDEALTLMAQVSGMKLAMRLRPFLGGKLALAFGLIYAGLRRAFVPKAERIGDVAHMLGEFIGLIASGTAAAASALDSPSAKRYVQWLEPLSAMPKRSTPFLVREFCLAVAETAAGEFGASSQRFACLIPLFSKPIEGVEEVLREGVYLGSLNGRAQAEVSSASPTTLAIADELGRGDPFFAPHAECARMAYYGYRGERDKAEIHRARAELLALRGGTSWSAVTVLTARLAYASMFSRDAIGLMQAIAELDRLTAVAPMLATCKRLCEARLEALRGRHAYAIALYEQVIDTADARSLASWRVDRVLFATVLNEAGEHARAKAICVALLADLPSGHVGDATTAMPRQQLALANAQLGDPEGASRELEQLIEEMQPLANPLQLGFAHADRARVALVAQDEAAFNDHFAAVEKHFQATRNATLIQHCDALLGEAVRAGLRVDPRRSSQQTDEVDELDGSTIVAGYEADEQVETQQRAGGGQAPQR